MLICKLVTTNLDAGVEIISTDYEVALDPLMENIVVHSYNDPINREAIAFDYETEEGRTYYGRVRALLTTGPTEWGPIEELKYENDNAAMLLTTPSPVNTPQLSTMFDVTQHPHGCFTIFGSEYEVIGDSKHVKTVWTLVDVLSGEVVHQRTTDINLYEYYVPILLDQSKQYRVTCIYYGDNDNVSMRGSLVFSTTPSLLIYTSLIGIRADEDYIITKENVYAPNNVHEWFLYNDKTELINDPSTIDTAITSFTIDETLLEYGETYLLQSREVDVEDGEQPYRYMVIRTDPSATYGLPQAFPYKLGYGSEIEPEPNLNTKYE